MKQEKTGIELMDMAIARRQEISDMVYNATKGFVARGPFEGMILEREQSWVPDGDLAPKLLGFYESDLYPHLEALKERNHDRMVNIGAAEGFYAVGLARMFPNAHIWAYDIDEDAQKVCGKAAITNRVAHRIEVKGLCDEAELESVLSESKRPFVLADIEGAEKNLFCPDKVPSLKRADFIVECHDCIDEEITELLDKRFKDTHDLQIVREQGRNPNALEGLWDMMELDRWLLVCEFRPCTMHWMVGRARP